MPETKLTVDQLRRIAEIEHHIKVLERVKHLVAELEQNRAARPSVLQGICETMARELSQMRQRAITSNIGTIADVAGAMSVMAARGGGINMKIRGLADGVNSLTLQLEQALKIASTPEPKRASDKRA